MFAAVLDPELCPCWRPVRSGLFMHGDVVYQNCLTLLPQPVSVCLNQPVVRGCPSLCWSLSHLSIRAGVYLANCPCDRLSLCPCVRCSERHCGISNSSLKCQVRLQLWARSLPPLRSRLHLCLSPFSSFFSFVSHERVKHLCRVLLIHFFIRLRSKPVPAHNFAVHFVCLYNEQSPSI